MSPLELKLVRKTSITTVVVVENISQLGFLLLENHLPLFAQTVSVLTAQFKVQVQPGLSLLDFCPTFKQESESV